MAARADPEEVISMTQTELDEEVVELLVDDANAWVNANLLECSSISDASLAIIERYIAAALVKAAEAGSEGTLIRSRRGDIDEQYAQVSVEKGGPGAPYLVIAAGLDPCGIVRRVFLGGKRIRYRVGTGFTEEAQSSCA